MKRSKILGWLAVCSCIVVFAVTCAFWPLSLWFQERVAYTTRHLYFAARTNPGTLTLEYHRYPISPFDEGWHAWHDPWEWKDKFTWQAFRGGLGLRREEFILDPRGRTFNVPPNYSIAGKTPSLNTGWTLDLPFWVIALASGVPLLWMGLRRIRKHLRYSADCCQVCGYDLRATPTRCPECGAIAAGQPTAE